MNWTTRLYQPGDDDAICELYERVFEMPMSLDRWRWQYIQNPTGKTAILLAVGEDGRLAGQYALSPVTMKVNDQTITAALSLDTMVHPDYRGQGMFTKLADDLYRRIAEQGIDLVYGFPNEQSHHGFVKNLKWIDLFDTLPLWVRPLNFKTVVAKVIKSDLLAGLGAPFARLGYGLVFRSPRKIDTVKIITSFDDRADQLWEKVKDLAPVMLKRDRRYLNWRYTQHPEYRYTIFAAERDGALLGYGILSPQTVAGMKAAFIVDLLAQTPDTARDVVAAMLNFAVREGYEVASALIPPHIPYTAVLKRFGFIPLPKRLFPQEMYLGVRNNTTRFPDALIHNGQNWYITWGDHDRI